MGRYRAPVKPGSKYITAEGAQRLKSELDRLWRVERPQVTQAVAAAAAQGDRSENAEYIYGKKHLREIDRRVRHLRQRLDGIVVVDQPPSDPARIYFGAWVEIEDDAGRERRVRIVGPDETDAAPGYISMDSPLGRALFGKRVDDSVRIEVPGGQTEYVVLAISYRAPSADT
jgi:transcription elongation factor GreB